jgi:hypothetical protein
VIDIYSSLPDEVRFLLTKEQLSETIEKAYNRGRYDCLQDVKRDMGFSTNKSFDDIAPMVKAWKEKHENKEA